MLRKFFLNPYYGVTPDFANFKQKKNAAISKKIKELQEYIQGGYIYVPAIQEKQKQWGELSGYRKELQERNKSIVAEYRSGVSIEELADKYFLSIYAIRKIIYQK